MFRCVTTYVAAALGCLLSVVFVSPVAAQSPPPVFPAVDAHGVDVATGAFTYSHTDVVIGPPGKGGLEFTRYYQSRPSPGWVNNHTGYIVRNDMICSVVIGTMVESFTATLSDCQGSFTADQQHGSTLTYNSSSQTYTYTSRDGAVATFARAGAYQYFTEIPLAAVGYLVSVAKPDGEVISYTYYDASLCVPNNVCITFSGLINVSNNLGYALYIQRVPGPGADTGSYLFPMVGVSGINNAVQDCAPTCTKTWPQASYGFDSNWNLASVSSSDGSIAYGYTGGLLSSIQFAGGPSPNPSINITYSSATAGQVASVDLGFGAWGYNYADATDRTATVTNPDLTTRVYVSSLTTGRINSVKDELGQTVNFQYDSAQRLTRITQPEHNYTNYTYDSRGNVTETRLVSKTPGTPADLVTTAVYPTSCTNPRTCNKPTSTTDTAGNQTDYTYDPTHGSVLTITAPAPSSSADRPQTRFTYAQFQSRYMAYPGDLTGLNGSPVWRLTRVSSCAVGNVSTCLDSAAETRSTLSYADANTPNNVLPISATTAAGDGTISATSSMTYTDWGDLRTVDGPLAGTADTTFYSYTGHRLAGVIGPDPDGTQHYRATRITYNEIGQPTVVESGTVSSQSDAALTTMAVLEKQDTVYDAYARPMYARAWDGSSRAAVTQMSYDSRGRTVCTAVRMNPAVFDSLPTSACTLGTSGTFGPDRISVKGYDSAGHLTSEQYGTGDAQTTATYTYTTNGQLHTLADARGYLTTYEYDGFDRLQTTRYPDPGSTNTSSTTDYEHLTYDAFGRIQYERRRSGDSFGYSYDNLGRIASRDAPGTEPDVSYGYDLLGRMTSEAQPGNTITHVYDALSRLTSETSSVLGAVSYGYDVAGRRTRLTYPDNFFVTYAYNVAGDLTNILESNVTSLASYTYDGLGRRKTLTRGNGVVSTYDVGAESKLLNLTLTGSTQNTVVGLAYNPAEQIVSRTRSNDAYTPAAPPNFAGSYSANGLNQYTNALGTALTYDTLGNLQSDGVRTFNYDFDNRLTSASGVSLSYDPAGRLHQVSGASTTRFLYDGADVIAEYNASGTMLRRYVHGPGMDEPLVWYETSGTSDRRWLLADERGSVIGVANASGTVTQVNKYDVSGLPDAGNQGRFQYTGQMWIPEIGLYYYKARFYHPRHGRFLQTDPIRYGGGVNLYAYAGNDPANLRDPSGLSCITIQPTDPQNGDPVQGCSDPAGPIPTWPVDLPMFVAMPVNPIDPNGFRLPKIVRNDSGPPPESSVVFDLFGFANKSADLANTYWSCQGGVCGDLWRGKNGKWNSIDWGGNQYTGARRNVLEQTYGLKVVGKVLFGADLLLNVASFYDALGRNDNFAAFNALADTGVDFIGVYGGNIGFAFAAGYEFSSGYIAPWAAPLVADGLCRATGNC